MSVLRDNVVPLYIYIDSDLIKEKKNILEEKSDGSDPFFFLCHRDNYIKILCRCCSLAH